MLENNAWFKKIMLRLFPVQETPDFEPIPETVFFSGNNKISIMVAKNWNL